MTKHNAPPITQAHTFSYNNSPHTRGCYECRHPLVGRIVTLNATVVCVLLSVHSKRERCRRRDGAWLTPEKHRTSPEPRSNPRIFIRSKTQHQQTPVHHTAGTHQEKEGHGAVSRIIPLPPRWKLCRTNLHGNFNQILHIFTSLG